MDICCTYQPLEGDIGANMTGGDKTQASPLQVRHDVLASRLPACGRSAHTSCLIFHARWRRMGAAAGWKHVRHRGRVHCPTPRSLPEVRLGHLPLHHFIRSIYYSLTNDLGSTTAPFLKEADFACVVPPNTTTDVVVAGLSDASLRLIFARSPLLRIRAPTHTRIPKQQPTVPVPHVLGRRQRHPCPGNPAARSHAWPGGSHHRAGFHDRRRFCSVRVRAETCTLGSGGQTRPR